MIRAVGSVRSPLHDVRKPAAHVPKGHCVRIRCFADYLFTPTSSAIKPSGGARRDRTDDLMLAKHALSQLSYGPVTRRRMLDARKLMRGARRPTLGGMRMMKVVGLGRLELPTSRLSSARSNQLSYKPLRRGGLPATSAKRCSTYRRPRRVFVREERETKTAASRQWSSKDLAI